MRILHVATLVSPDGAFGGPVSVAAHQVRELRRRGHEAFLLAATTGYPRGAAPTAVLGAPLVPLPAARLGRGFSGLLAPHLVHAALGLDRFDVLHFHLGRDLVTMPLARVAAGRGLRFVVQTHGMVAASRHPLALPFDVLGTRAVLRAAEHVFSLTPAEDADLEAVSGRTGIATRLLNGIDLPALGGPPADPPQVLFLSRLHPRKRPVAFVRMAKQLLAAGVRARFVLVGPDEGEGPAVVREIAGYPQDQLAWLGAVSHTDAGARVREASVLVLPSLNEPFGMVVLEAMAHARPVVVSRSSGLADHVRRAGAGLVVGDDLREIAAAVAELLGDPERARRLGEAGRRLVEREFSVAATVDRLEAAYA